MDSTEDDISARVLLRKVLHTELPRSPVTRSANSVRRSLRIKNTPALESPGSALRHRLKKKLHESTSMSPLPSPKRRRSAVAKPDPPPSLLYDEDMTTRGLLRGIIQMETDASLLMSGQPALQESEPNPAESSVSSAGERTEGLSGVELSDLTLNTEPLTHVVRGLSRRKPQRAFSVSAFEKQLDQLPDNTKEISHVSHRGDAPHEKPDTSQDLDFSAGSKSGLNLTLKTPFVDKRTERAGLQRKVSNRRLPSVDAFDQAVQRCLEQGPKQDRSAVLDGKTLDDSSWQKLTLGLNDVTELYIQMKQDNTVGPSAEMDRDAESERDNQENRVSEVPDVRRSSRIFQEEKDHEMESPSQEEEEVVPSSQEAGDVLLSPEYDVVLAPTQAMTESLPESQDAEPQDRKSVEETQHEEVVEEVESEEVMEEVEHENMEEIEDEVEENPDSEHYPERIARRAHRSEGGDVILGIPATMRVTKSFGAGLNPREKDPLGFVGSRESLQDVPDEERKQPGSPASLPLYPSAEITTSEQRTQQHEASLPEGDVLDSLPEGDDDDDPPEEVNQSGEEGEEEELKDSESANKSPEPSQEEELIDSEPANKIHEPPQEEEELIDSEPANLSPEPSQEEEELIDSEPANQSFELQQEEEEEIMDSEPANQSLEPAQEEEEDVDDDDDDDDALSAELSMKTPAFIRQKRVFASPTAQATPTVLKEVNAGPAPQVGKRAPRQKRQAGADVLPKSYVMSVFKHFAKTKVASDVYPAINEILKKYFDRLADDLETYATHAKRKTIEVEDFELLMRRQGFVTDGTPVNILIEKYLPLEYRKLLIPVATSGNKVIPKQRR